LIPFLEVTPQPWEHQGGEAFASCDLPLRHI
jgi:hypothetical protein